MSPCLSVCRFPSRQATYITGSRLHNNLVIPWPCPQRVGRPYASVIPGCITHFAGELGLNRGASPPARIHHFRWLRPLGPNPSNVYHGFSLPLRTSPKMLTSLASCPPRLLFQGFCPTDHLPLPWPPGLGTSMHLQS